MRPIGYVAAAAAGMIAPIAFALPAMAATQSPLLAGASVVDSADDNPHHHDDNNDDNNDNNNDNNNNNDDYNDLDDDVFNDNDLDDLLDDVDEDILENGDVDAVASGSIASGDYAILLEASDLGAFDEFEVSSPGLDAACESENIIGAVVESDRFGHIDVAGTVENCIPGTYVIAVSQTGDQEDTVYGEVTLH